MKTITLNLKNNGEQIHTKIATVINNDQLVRIISDWVVDQIGSIFKQNEEWSVTVADDHKGE